MNFSQQLMYVAYALLAFFILVMVLQVYETSAQVDVLGARLEVLENNLEDATITYSEEIEILESRIDTFQAIITQITEREIDAATQQQEEAEAEAEAENRTSPLTSP